MKDIYLFFHGRNIKLKADHYALRNTAAIISEVVNRTMGGKGTWEAVKGMWQIDEGDSQGGKSMSREDRKKLIQWHNEQINKKK